MESALAGIEGLDNYLERFGALLARRMEQTCVPLHKPGVDEVVDTSNLLRQPYTAQSHCITGAVRAIERTNGVIVSAECGAGKSLMAQAISQCHAKGAYRAMVMCPPHLVEKWEREIKDTVRNPIVRQVRTYADMVNCHRHARPFGRTWWIVSHTRAKMGAKWRPSYVFHRPRRGKQYALQCPDCFKPIMLMKKLPGMPKKEATPASHEDLADERMWCEHCKGALWTHTSELDRWPIARYIHKKLKGFFQYCIVDESHATKSSESAVGQATAALVAACDKTLFLTGTLMGGYAWHIRPAIYRLAPSVLIKQGLAWDDEMAFNEKYGRIERRVTEIEKHGGTDNRQSKGKSTRTSKYVRPGIMPTLFAKVLCEHTIFLSLDEVSDALPPLNEHCVAIELDDEQRVTYDEVEEKLGEAVKRMLQKKDKRLLAKMLQTLLGYPDRPFGWEEIGYEETTKDGSHYVPVVTPPDLRTDVVRPKEQALLDWIAAGRQDGRQSWVYCQMTDKRDVQPRLMDLLQQHGLKTAILRANVGTDKREEWIRQNGPKYDVILSHPQLVETGLDLFDKGGAYNFSRLGFYQCGYNLFTMRQASRRAWRLAQTLPCEVAYFYYEQTMQARAMTLMGKKLQAAQLIEGCFSTEGLAALGGEDDSLDIALAKSLVHRLDDLDVGRTWSKLAALTVGAA